MPTRLLTRHGVAVGEANGTVHVMAKGDSPTTMPAKQFDQLSSPTLPGPAATSAPGRLWAANLAAQAGAIKGNWSAPVIAAAAQQLAVSSLGARRAAALDAIALNQSSIVDSLQLSAWEISWYRAWTADAGGDVPGLLRWLETLPPTGYTMRINLLVRRASALLADPALAARAAALVLPFAAILPDAWALARALRAPSHDDPIGLPAYAGEVARVGGPAYASIEPIAEAIRHRQRLPQMPATAGPRLRAFDAYLAGQSGTSLDAAVDQLVPLPRVLLDDLITARSLTQLPGGRQPWSAEVTAYVRCRLDPGGADLAELRAAGFTAELARRFFLTGDTDELARLPEDDPDVRHYRALYALRTLGAAEEAGNLRPAARSILALAERLRSATAEHSQEAPAEFAADPSVWPLVQEAALRGGVTVSQDVRSRYPEFADWLELCGTQRLVFEGRWDEVIAAGRRVAAASGLESIRDEAENMVAFAEWQLGRPVEALQVLEDALRGEFTTGLVVNAALVAAEQGSLTALPYLDRAMRLSTDPRVRQGALSQAIGLWLQDDDVQDYPPQLAKMVHDALSAPQPDTDFHRTLLILSVNNDYGWLADASPHAEGKAQSDAVRYFRTRARVLSIKYKETLKDVAELLVALWPSHPDWVEREKTWMSELLIDLVHVDFGEAIGAVEPIEVLIKGNILGLAERLVLSAQAGAHLTVGLREARSALVAPEYERQLLFDPVTLFHSRRNELVPKLQEIVAEELAKCLVVSMLAVGSLVESQWVEFGENWDLLVQRERWDHANRYQIINLERALLNDIDPYIARVRHYVTVLKSLPMTEAQQEIRDTIDHSTARWSAESARLRSLL
jgi:hypothetical protein